MGKYNYGVKPAELKMSANKLERRTTVVKPGFTYDGEWIIGTNKKEGRGVLVSRLGTIYEGWFRNDKFHFHGRIIW